MAKKRFLAALISLVMFLPPAQAYTPSCNPPPFVSAGANPMVMMVMERDHKLYYEAYNDAQDLDGDGKLDVGYDNDIEYFGYFDPYKCYIYQGGGQDKFVPSRYTASKKCGEDGEWSGNFLNWLSMSRMDVLRRVLYGGHRSTDSSSETVLEGVYIPQDAHSWGKEYAGSDTRYLTPFDPPSPGTRHLFCVTSTANGEPHKIRVALNDPNRIWDWATTERAVCSGPETPDKVGQRFRHGPVGTRSDITDYIVRVQVCSTDWKQGLEKNYCKLYPGGGNTPKPVGLLQKYGEGGASKMCSETGEPCESNADCGAGKGSCVVGSPKMCSKTYKPCQTDANCGANEGLCVFRSPLYMGFLTGSYTKNLSGGVLRKNIWTVMDEINTQSGSFQSSENVQGNIILTLDRMQPVGFEYSNFSYTSSEGGNCGWITTRPLSEGECRMWGNPVGEMMYEALRFLTGKGTPTPGFTYSQNADANLSLSKPNWFIKKGNLNLYPFDLFPDCSKPNLLVLSDINPSYDSNQLPGAYSEFGSFSGDLSGLNVGSLADTIGNQEGLNNGTFFIGQSGTNYDFICSAKSLANLSSVRGLCPEEPTKQGSFYSAAVAYYGKEFINAKEGIPEVNTYVVAMSSPIPDIRIKVGSHFVQLVPVGKSVSGCYNVKSYCADKCSPTSGDRGLALGSCTSNAYCPSNQIVDFYVDNATYDNQGNMTFARFRVNFEDVEQGADHDMDALVIYEIEPTASNQVKVKLKSESAAGCIDQVLGFVISGTTEDGLYLPVRDVPDAQDSEPNDTHPKVAGLPLEWSKTFTVSGSPAQTLKNPLWYAAKWGGFDDLNGNHVPDLLNEWDKDGDGTPDNYFFVANPLELEKKLEKALLDILTKSGSAGAVATVTQEVLGQDLVVRGAFTAYDENLKTYAWRGHLEAYWPYNGCSDFSVKTACESYAGCEWKDENNSCAGTLYSFQKPQNSGKFCSDPAYVDGHCWDAGKILKNTDPASRCVFTYINDNMTKLDAGSSTCSMAFYASLQSSIADLRTIMANNVNFDGDSDNDTSDADALIQWIKGQWQSSWENNARNRQGWTLGDIVYSTPVVVGQPSIGSVHPNIAGDCNCLCSDNASSYCARNCFYCYRQIQRSRKKMVYVGANDGMLHAFVVGVWWDDPNQGIDNDGDGRADESHWIYSPDEPATACDGYECTGREKVGKELWAYVPGNLLGELRALARCDYGHPSACAHRTMVDLSPVAWDVFIDHDGDGKRAWRTVLLGGERGGGDVYFAVDVTDPDRPKVLWEYPALRNLVIDNSTAGTEAYAMPFLDKSVYDQVRTVPVSWTVPYVGYMDVNNASFNVNEFKKTDAQYVPRPVRPLESGSPVKNEKPLSSSDLSGWFAFMGATPRVFRPNSDLPNTLSSAQKNAVLKPHLLAIDIEKGVNIFQYLWPKILHQWSSQWPTVTSGDNTVPYALGDPLVLDLWDDMGAVRDDGKADYVAFGDMNGNFYTLKFNFPQKRIHMTVRKTKASPAGTNIYRSTRQPITVMPVATVDPDNKLRLFFGTGKFDDVVGGSDDRTDTDNMTFYGLADNSTQPISFSGGLSIGGLNITAAFPYNSTSFLGNCTWTKADGNPDCCETSCSGSSCWSCVLDLKIPGERVVDSALVASGIVFFTTFVPKDDPCAAGGDAYLYALDYLCRPLTVDPFGSSGFAKANKQVKDLEKGEYVLTSSAAILKIGEGMPSRPVMDSSSEYLFIQTSNGEIHRIQVDFQEPNQKAGWKQRQ